MKKHYDIWNIFHDGGIEQIEGTVPGSIRIKVGIENIRHMFSKDGDSFLINIFNCSIFQYEPWDESPIIHELSEIAKLEPDILSAKDQENDEIIVYTDGGNIRMKYTSATYALDNGKTISYEELDEACNTFWDNWEKKKP